jgi:hypothetical protein
MPSSSFRAPGFQPRTISRALVFAGFLSLGAGAAVAGTFTVTGSSTTAQTLGTGSSQTGTVSAAGTLSVSGSVVAITVSGADATISNLGTVLQTGTGRVIRDNTGVSGLMITNGSITNATALMQAADADVIQMNKSPASVTLNNYGQIISLNASAGGSQAVDFTAIVSGTNVVNNFSGGLIKATEADAVRAGVGGVVNNYGTIQSVTTKGNSSDGVDVQSNSAAQIANFATGLIDGGRAGIAGGALDATVSFNTLVNNAVGGNIRGNDGSGINLDGFNNKQLVSVVNGGTISGNGVTGDGDGVDVDGLVNITNSGIIRSINAFSAVGSGLAYSEGITVGGGTITNSGTIEGLVAAGNTNALGRGISLLGNDITSGPLVGTREAIYANAVITNQAGGLIRGGNDAAIYVGGPASGFTVVINNNAGATILGGGATSAAIQTGADNDSVNNAGMINGTSSGRAIDMGAGNNTLYVSGGSASILGSINGGVDGVNTMTVAPGAGQSFAYAGSISNFGSVEIVNGHVTFSGVSDYVGTTRISGGTLTLDGMNRLSASSALALNGGTLEIINACGCDGQSFASLSLLDNSSIALNFSKITFASLGTVAQGKTLSVTDGAGDYSFRLAGDMSTNADFLRLIGQTTVNGLAASYRFDGVYTDVTAVPEPESLAMLLAGLGFVGVTTRRRKQKDCA